jgi:hypothetical protein
MRFTIILAAAAVASAAALPEPIAADSDVTFTVSVSGTPFSGKIIQLTRALGWHIC